jgi:hypothetical protein
VWEANLASKPPNPTCFKLGFQIPGAMNNGSVATWSCDLTRIWNITFHRRVSYGCIQRFLIKIVSCIAKRGIILEWCRRYTVRYTGIMALISLSFIWTARKVHKRKT